VIELRQHAANLLDEYSMSCQAQVHHSVVDVQIDKDRCSESAILLKNVIAWGTDEDVQYACDQLEPRLKRLQEKIILEVLKDDSIQ